MTPAATDDIHRHVARARGPRSSLVLGVLVLAAVVSTRWVRLNLSPSVPVGVYAVRRVPAQLHREELVLLPAPANVRPWHSRLVRLLKPIAGLPISLRSTYRAPHKPLSSRTVKSSVRGGWGRF